MSTSIEDLNGNLWWRPRREWHLGFLDHEVRWIEQGRKPPEHWEFHRAGSLWAYITYLAVRRCAAAGHPNVEYMIWRSEIGYISVALTCLGCGEKLTPQVGNKELRANGLSRDDLRVANSGLEAREECVRCGSTESVQYHHWAPKHLFPHDADTWPGDYLCQPCHSLWHGTVTPRMTRKTA